MNAIRPSDDTNGRLAISPANTADAPALADVYLTTRAKVLPFLRSAHSPDAVRHWISDILVPRGTTWVARQADIICGFLTLDAAQIDQMYLRYDMRRKGIGTALLAHAKCQSPETLSLVTFRQNYGARAFYETHGFRPVSFRDGSHNEERVQDVIYEWRPA